jgi:hypothetical protein
VATNLRRGDPNADSFDAVGTVFAPGSVGRARAPILTAGVVVAKASAAPVSVAGRLGPLRGA